MTTNATTNPNDTIRRQILEYFYDRNKNATSRQGKKGSAVKIGDAKRELKERYGLTQQQVMSNITYLKDKGWINVFDVEKTVFVGGGTRPSTTTWYEISADGIDKIDGESEFKQTPRWAGINIHANASIITLGDGNVVHASHADLYADLDGLRKAVEMSDGISDDDKVGIAADIEALKDQLVKEKPDPTVLQRLWGGVERFVTGAEFVDYAIRISPAIAALGM